MNKDQIAFVKSLAGDVQWSLDQITHADTQAARRNMLRTFVAAAEGISWVFRMQILAIAKECDASSPAIEMAFAEAAYTVTAAGEIREQARFVPLTAMIRLTTKVAQSYCPDLVIDFGLVGWEDLKRAIAARNRITHPKGDDDFLVRKHEIDAAKSGFFWFADMAVGVMEHAMKTVAEYRDFAQKLIAGDPDARALYERAHQDMMD